MCTLKDFPVSDGLPNLFVEKSFIVRFPEKSCAPPSNSFFTSNYCVLFMWGTRLVAVRGYAYVTKSSVQGAAAKLFILVPRFVYVMLRAFPAQANVQERRLKLFYNSNFLLASAVSYFFFCATHDAFARRFRYIYQGFCLYKELLLLIACLAPFSWMLQLFASDFCYNLSISGFRNRRKPFKNESLTKLRATKTPSCQSLPLAPCHRSKT